MAACPCGCGKRLGMMSRRLAQKAVEVTVGVGALKAGRESILKGSPAGQLTKFTQLYDKVVSDGDGMAGVMLDYAHGDRGPMTRMGLPASGDLGLWQRTARVQIQSLRVIDPEALDGYAQRLDPKGRRLIASMG